ncbi:MAG: YqeG family HAD IIIA-type phosphatase [Limosilactobacillus gorillae]|uniref:YqeG family HAD IIIA-type phosphatase n=1 Tax=Limosilactobacillus gorillae TaxID=1450649 RepID=UPI000A5B66E7|nr:YqeG family HAD IIIA-type phosphatase [Limosilactobacillus gorillae]MDO4855459.1 YqeG family HAD IIIA-type phosphatase [Limosilactobacillus gorillae]
MIEKFKPTWMVNSIYRVSPEQLKAQGIRTVFSDLDNTLIAWNNPNGTQELRDWMMSLKAAGIPLIVISNNSHRRVERAVAPLNLPFVSRALKPMSFGITRARMRLGLEKDEVVMVGDQLLTDVAAANTAGVRSILVRPLVASDQWNTKFNRIMEKQVKRALRNNYPALTWQEELND